MSDILHIIYLWRKGHISHKLLTFHQQWPMTSKKSIIGWLQALMGLMSHDWAEIQNTYLQSLGSKISGQIWISSQIRKLWYKSWDIPNWINHTLHSSEGPKKTVILDINHTIVTLHLNKGMIGLTKICHFLFKTNIHTLLSFPVRQCLSCLELVSRSCQFSQINYIGSSNILDTNQLLLIRIHASRLISALTTFDQTPPSRTVARPNKNLSFIEIE